MNELDFRTWLSRQNANKKVVSDIVSRLKRIEREITLCDIDKNIAKMNVVHCSPCLEIRV